MFPLSISSQAVSAQSRFVLHVVQYVVAPVLLGTFGGSIAGNAERKKRLLYTSQNAIENSKEQSDYLPHSSLDTTINGVKESSNDITTTRIYQERSSSDTLGVYQNEGDIDLDLQSLLDSALEVNINKENHSGTILSTLQPSDTPESFPSTGKFRIFPVIFFFFLFF